MSRRAIVAFPEGGQLALIEAFRGRHDPLAREIPAHVTLVFPFASALSGQALRSHIEIVAAETSPFTIRLEGVAATDDGYLFLNIGAGSAAIRWLHDHLYAGSLASYRSRTHGYEPHVTIGRFTNASDRMSALHEAAQALPAFEARISALSVYRLGAQDPGFTELDVPLGTP